MPWSKIGAGWGLMDPALIRDADEITACRRRSLGILSLLSKRVTSSAFAWLADHQPSIAAPLSHVDELVGQISDLLFVYQTRPDAIFELEEHLGLPPRGPW